MTVALLNVIPSALYPASPALSFIIARADGGWPYDQRQVMEEELSSPGVNGRRFRTVFDQFPETTVETLSSVTNYTAAVAEARQHLLCKGRLARLSVVVGGATLTYPKVHILDCAPVARVGSVVAADLTGAGASVACTWRLVLMQDAAS